MIINRDSFIATGPADAHGSVPGTVEVTLGGQTRRVEARFLAERGWVTAFGLVGRYLTGAKAWPASVMSDPDGRERVSFGRDDHHPKFNKSRGLSFA